MEEEIELTQPEEQDLTSLATLYVDYLKVKIRDYAVSQTKDYYEAVFLYECILRKLKESCMDTSNT